MSGKPIVKDPASVLHELSAEVAPGSIRSVKIRRLIQDMKATLHAAPDGVGLAAPQIGHSLKVFLVSDEANYIGKASDEKWRDERKKMRESGAEKSWDLHVFINPEFKRTARKKDIMIEGCLSIPGKFGGVSRSEKVELVWYDEAGIKHTRGFSGFYARVIQHEMDHLDGFLIKDRVKKLVDLETLKNT